MSIILVAGHQMVKNLIEPSEITLVHLEIYADYLRERIPSWTPGQCERCSRQEVQG